MTEGKGNDGKKAPRPCHPRGGGDPGYWPICHPRLETILSLLNLPFVPIMSLLRQNIPVLLNGLDIIIILLTGYESTFLRLWFGTDIAHKESVATKKRLTAPRSTKRNKDRKEKKDGRRKSDRILQSG